MPREPIPDEVRRFILTSVPSVPFIEALLIFMARPDAAIATSEIARGLYVSEPAAAQIVRQLEDARIVQAARDSAASHRYAAEPELARLLGQVAALYAGNLIGMTDLIHSRTGRKAQQFADAFKLRKDS